MDEERIIQTERLVLQVLCQDSPEGFRKAGRKTLKAYRWREPVHEAIFHILMTIQSDSSDLIRDQLPSRLTRKGFPDVAWEDFFEPHALTKQDAIRLMRRLAGST